MKIGVLCPSEIAFRRFMPALQKCESFCYAGIGVSSFSERFGEESLPLSEKERIRALEYQKAEGFQKEYGGVIFDSYEGILTSDVEAVYLPLPPALHFPWAKKALDAGKHVFVEKPATISYEESNALVALAKEKGLALCENYMFVFHKQLEEIQKLVKSGKIGEERLISLKFGFPMRAANDFRYNKKLGGGALIDAGGYAIRYASMLLGDTMKVQSASLSVPKGFEVDLFGSASAVNDEGLSAQISFGMDNDYRCELEIWGSKGTLRSGRVFTAPVGFVPSATISVGKETETVSLSPDDTFLRSIEYFRACVEHPELRAEAYDGILRQASLVDQVRFLAGKDR